MPRVASLPSLGHDREAELFAFPNVEDGVRRISLRRRCLFLGRKRRPSIRADCREIFSGSNSILLFADEVGSAFEGLLPSNHDSSLRVIDVYGQP